MLLHGFFLQLLIGLKVTLAAASGALLVGLTLGLIFTVLAQSASRPLLLCLNYLTTALRGLPEIIVLFAIYFGSSIIISWIFGEYKELNAITTGVIALGIIFAAYAMQIFRGALLAIPTGQITAAKTLGFTNWLTLKNILLPQIWHHALPGLSNLWLTTLKDSALLALIGAPDVMSQAQIAANATHKPFTFYMAAALIYLMLTTISQILIHYLNPTNYD